MRSLKARLVTLWALSLLSSLVLGLLLLDLRRQSAEAQVGRTEAVLARACDMIRDRFGFYATDWSGPAAGVPDDALRRDLEAVLTVALARQDGVEGGVWAAGTGSLAYAYPTYEGSGPKTDLPAAEAAPIVAVNAAALREERTVGQSVVTRSQTLLLAACPLNGPVQGLTAWTMGRVRTAEGLRAIQIGLPVLLALLVLTALLLGRTLVVWGRHVRGIEAALGGMNGGLPLLARSGERELDRIVDALNLAGTRLAGARREADAMAGRVARAERLAALGRVAAGVAHEIRNPIAAARLQGENALAGDDHRRRQGIADMLEQLARLDTLVSELLAMTQRVQPRPTAQDPAVFLRDLAARHAAAVAARNGLALNVRGDPGAACFDPAIVARILDNLVTNAIRHAVPGSAVTLSVAQDGGVLTFAVADNGDGVPSGIADRLFEPFVTGRADGTGLGLAIARELADAHGGRLLLRNRGGPGAITDFALELPQDAPCPPAPPS